jgi:hypothetical protein
MTHDFIQTHLINRVRLKSILPVLMIVCPGGLAWPKRLLGKQKIAGPNPARGST